MSANRCVAVTGLLIVAMTLMQPVSIDAQRASTASAAPSQTPTLAANLLTNGGFEGSFVREWNSTNHVWTNGRVAEGWTAWWRQPTDADGKYPGRCEPDDAGCQAWHAPEYRETYRIPYTPPRIREGENSQVYFTTFGLHEGGVYQKVGGVPIGWRVRFSLWALAWSGSDAQSALRSSGQPSMHVQVGIDPNGGADPWSADVVWSQESDSFDEFSLLSVDATTRSDTVTVFVRSRPERALAYSAVALDDAELSALGPPPPTPVVIEAPNTVAGAPTLIGTPRTPIVHAVQPGDTLFAIAQYYRVDLGAIYAANGLNETSVLKVGQSIIIPLAAATPPPTAVPTPMPVPVAIGTLCVSAFEDAGGDGRYDEGDSLLADVAFIVTDPSGAAVAASDTRSCFGDLPVGAYSVVAQMPAGYLATTVTAWSVALPEKARVEVIAGGQRAAEPETHEADTSGGPIAMMGVGLMVIAAVLIGIRRRANNARS